jgi:hypothetical protein
VGKPEISTRPQEHLRQTVAQNAQGIYCEIGVRPQSRVYGHLEKQPKSARRHNLPIIQSLTFRRDRLFGDYIFIANKGLWHSTDEQIEGYFWVYSE